MYLNVSPTCNFTLSGTSEMIILRDPTMMATICWGKIVLMPLHANLRHLKQDNEEEFEEIDEVKVDV